MRLFSEKEVVSIHLGTKTKMKRKKIKFIVKHGCRRQFQRPAYKQRKLESVVIGSAVLVAIASAKSTKIIVVIVESFLAVVILRVGRYGFF